MMRLLLFMLMIFAGPAFAECVGPDNPHCRFENAPTPLSPDRVILPGIDRDHYQTTRPLGFLDASGVLWTAPPGTVTDGASIPDAFLRLIGDRLAEEYLHAAIIHDAYCGNGNEKLFVYQSRRWEDVHRAFYDAMIVGGTPPVKAKIMFAAVYLGGPRWREPSRSLEGLSEAALLQEMEWCMRWIEEVNPTRERIVEWMKGREPMLRAGTAKAPDFDALRALGPLPKNP